ncbi:hypothetical protein [Microcoleus sp. OTE_8_concoct_300]|uniref:hypothetical protein n=1 Tax=Microcoleus sp. OTE_8_concoct_300 TaxID=2964710 RepID=UPI00403F7A43
MGVPQTCGSYLILIPYTGVGEVVYLKELSVSQVQSPIGKVLTQEWYQKRPIALQDAIGRSGPVKKAGDIIEQVVLTRKPILAEK